MKAKLIVNLQRMIVALALLSSCAVSAQPANQPFDFKKGDEYLRRTTTSSSSLLQLGKVKIDISSTSRVAKSYKVTDADNDGYTFEVTTKQIIDSLRSGNSNMVFNSDQPLDQQSKLAVALNFMIGKPSTVNIDRHGVISSVNPNNPILANDSLYTFTGINDEPYAAGSRFVLLSDIAAEGKLKEGTQWADSVTMKDGSKVSTNYLIYQVNENFVTLQFSMTVTNKVINTNTNGVYMIDRRSGVIAKRQMRSISNGYEVYNHVVYNAARTSSLSESVYKVN